MKKGRLEEAIGHFTNALEQKPTFAHAHNNLGNALIKAGNWEEARRHFEEALRLRPDYPDARATLTRLLEMRGEARKN